LKITLAPIIFEHDFSAVAANDRRRIQFYVNEWICHDFSSLRILAASTSCGRKIQRDRL